MQTKLHIGISGATDTQQAIAEATAQCRRTLRDRGAMAVVLSTRHYEAGDLAPAVHQALDGIPWAGGCFEGVFTADAILHRGVLIAIAEGEDMRVGIGVAGPVSDDPAGSGARAVANAIAALPTNGRRMHRTFIVFPDAKTGNAAAVVRGAALEGGSAVAWAGGGAMGEQPGFANGVAYRDHVVVLAVDAPQPFGTGLHHGWRPYGEPTMVTRARGNVAIELDYERAFDVYRRTAASRGDEVTTDDFPNFAMTHPLGIPQADGAHVIRDPLGVEPDGGLRCVAEVPDGCLVRVMQGDREELIDAARQAATGARDGVSGPPGGALVFDCVSRSLILRDDMEREVSTLRAALGPDVPIAGCLTFGEVGAQGASVPQFHNKTAVVLALPGGDG